MCECIPPAVLPSSGWRNYISQESIRMRCPAVFISHPPNVLQLSQVQRTSYQTLHGQIYCHLLSYPSTSYVLVCHLIPLTHSLGVETEKLWVGHKRNREKKPLDDGPSPGHMRSAGKLRWTALGKREGSPECLMLRCNAR